MDEAGVDIAIVTLTSPNVFWGSAKQSLEAARVDALPPAQRDAVRGGNAMRIFKL